MIMDDATRRQVDAARPDASTWLGANAGSGKTRVLTDRVARLLLSGVEPQHILCLTYTKAAASEMQNRLFKRLGEWAMLDNKELERAMQDLGVAGPLDSDRLRRARTLFALAIETPGGLKIQTIHSFCASLLRRFPLEARVSPQFTEIEDRAADLLRADVLDDMAQGPDAALITTVASFYSGEDFGSLTKRLVGMRDRFQNAPNLGDIQLKLGQPPDVDKASITQSVFLGGEERLIKEILPHLLASGVNDKKAGDALAAIPVFDFDALAQFEAVFLTKSGKKPFTAKIPAFPTKATRTAISADLEELEAFMLRVEDARDARVALETAQKTLALHDFARAFLVRYETAKQARGWLDFDDLIHRARALLHDREVAAWVLYRIDGGIDHILVDEAQDTSPRQWDVIESLAQEFHSGQGARAEIDRTLFVVGDKKQSIYSFQGADPLEFDRRSVTFENRFTAANEPFQRQSLDYSFRSSSAILRLVDTVFDPARRDGFDKQSQHIAFKSDLPGRVDLWPVIEQNKDDEDQPWTDPLDRPSPQNHNVVLANKIAAQISELINGDHFIPDDGKERGTLVKRPVRAGDFLILVQRRSTLFAEIIRACKAADLPIAGADRLKVGGELAVKDLAAALSFLSTPDDSLSLATALKSPLFGWDEQALFDLAHRRTVSSLWEALRKRADDFPETMAVLNDLRGQIDFMRPYDLIERILTRHDGRRKLLARLGAEAEDGINALLTQALAYERNDVPSLTGFIEWMQTDDLEIKRQIDSASDQIRVMTVHGSKGLEAPIVILPETQDRQDRIKDDVITLEGTALWKPRAEAQPSVVTTRLQAMKDAQAEERLRLLYVAMTRAEKWLIVAAAGKVTEGTNAWYGIISEAMDHVNAVEIDQDGTKRFAEGDWDGLPEKEIVAKPRETSVLESVFGHVVPTEANADTVDTPTKLEGAKALPGAAGDETDAAMAYGTLIHTLLENLPLMPPAKRQAGAEHLTSAAEEGVAKRAVSEALRVLDTPALAALFDPGSLTEVAITGDVGNRRLHGVIDRLVIGDDRVLLVDYKTNREVPKRPEDCPEGILRQMGAYATMLAQIYPDHRIETAVLWTRNATLMTLPHDLVTNAMWRSPHLDGGDARS